MKGYLRMVGWRLFWVVLFVIVAMIFSEGCTSDPPKVVREVVEVVITATPKPAPKPTSTPIAPPQEDSGNPTVNDVFSSLPDSGTDLMCTGPQWEQDQDGDWFYTVFCYDDRGTTTLDDDFGWGVDAYAVGWGRGINDPIDFIVFSFVTDLDAPDVTYDDMAEVMVWITESIFQNDYDMWDRWDQFFYTVDGKQDRDEHVDGYHFVGTVDVEDGDFVMGFLVDYPDTGDYDASLRPQT